MTEDANNLSCAAFQAQLAELSGAGAYIAVQSHIQKCERCRALLADLEAIANAARHLPPVAEPPEELWEHIELAIKNEESCSNPG
jgi:predicted anti-sigma-YlaC factor YlaD